MCPVRSYILGEKGCPAAVWINGRWLGFLFHVLSSGVWGDTASSAGFLSQIPHCNRDQDYEGAVKLSCSSVAHNGCIFSLFSGGFSLGIGWKGVLNLEQWCSVTFQAKICYVFTCDNMGLGLVEQLCATVPCRVTHGASPSRTLWALQQWYRTCMEFSQCPNWNWSPFSHCNVSSVRSLHLQSLALIFMKWSSWLIRMK